MADEVELASKYESLERINGISQAARNMHKRSLVSLTHCLECGEEIPKKRRQAEPGCELCVKCKAWKEKGGAFWP
ncbi:MAG: TraR/DksA C4-type zinc finger protein [Deltaproteobacteria bacterium]|nr:TraR/DksA C4-type zinc finger protein [Deltaproteobacteria bacterium]